MTAILAIISKDIVIELRSKESISAMLMFGILVLVVFMFAVDPSVDRLLVAPGILWVAFSFAAILGLNRSLSMELDNDCLQGLLLAPIGRGELYIGKVASNFTFMMIFEIIMLPIFVILNNLSFILKYFKILYIGVLGQIGICFIGTHSS